MHEIAEAGDTWEWTPKLKKPTLVYVNM